MATELKSASKAVLAAASELHEARGNDELNDFQRYLLLAVASLQKAEESTEDDDERKTAKRLRKQLQQSLPESTATESNATIEKKGLDLGQYAHTKVFAGNEKKTEKFARLMGGAHSSGQPHHHATFAADSKTAERVNHELENQFQQAMQHKGKKGLGL